MLVGFLRLSPRANANLALILIVALPLFSFLLFRFGHVWLPPSAALIGLLFVYPLWGWRRLQAISSYMTGELRQLDAENDAFPRRHRVLSVREVTLQAGLLGQAIDRLRDLRRFLSDAIGRLPDALFVTGLDGRLALTNAEGRRLARRLGAPSEVGADLRILLDRFRASDGTGFSPSRRTRRYAAAPRPRPRTAAASTSAMSRSATPPMRRSAGSSGSSTSPRSSRRSAIARRRCNCSATTCARRSQRSWRCCADPRPASPRRWPRGSRASPTVRSTWPKTSSSSPAPRPSLWTASRST
ncbi:hypothetical protein ACFSTI_28295 [Rhizorhabdus histidinilytica]